MNAAVKALASATAVAVLILAGCSSDSGGDDEASETTGTESQVVNLDEWLMQVDAICADYNEQFDEMGDPPESAKGIAEFVVEGSELAQAQVDEIAAVGTPDEMQEEVEEVVDLLGQQLDVFEDLGNAAEENDAAGMQDALEAGEELEGQLDDLAADLGLEECGADDEDTTSTTGDTATDDTGSDGLGGDLSEADSEAFIEEARAGLVGEGFTEEEADCIIDGLLDQYSLQEIGGFVADGSIQDAMTDIVLDCVTFDRLQEIGGG